MQSLLRGLSSPPSPAGFWTIVVTRVFSSISLTSGLRARIRLRLVGLQDGHVGGCVRVSPAPSARARFGPRARAREEPFARHGLHTWASRSTRRRATRASFDALRA